MGRDGHVHATKDDLDYRSDMQPMQPLQAKRTDVDADGQEARGVDCAR